MRTAALAITLLIAAPAAAQQLHVTDGDTIKLNGTTWRLWGIDAPETHQLCAGGYPSGQEATGTLAYLMKGKTVTCEAKTHDRYGRTVGVCWADHDDLGAAMVELGQAWAFVRYSRDYVGLEEKARRENLGIHAHHCQPAWEWRAERR